MSVIIYQMHFLTSSLLILAPDDQSLIVKKFCHSFIFSVLMNNTLHRNELKFDKKGFPRHAIICFCVNGFLRNRYVTID